MMGYPQIKGELEEDFKKLDFEHCIILRPGLLMGSRCVLQPLLVSQGPEQRIGEVLKLELTHIIQRGIQRSGMGFAEDLQRTEVYRITDAASHD